MSPIINSAGSAASLNVKTLLAQWASQGSGQSGEALGFLDAVGGGNGDPLVLC